MKDLDLYLDEVIIDKNIEYERTSDEAMLFKLPKYHTSFFKSLKEFQNNEKFCDIVLKPSRNSFRSIKAHKIVLASASGYFRSMFAGGNKKGIFFA